METFASSLKTAMQVKRLRMRPLALQDRAVFHRNMVFLFHMVKGSASLLRVGMYMTTDPELRAFYAEHLEQERDHCDWLRDDLVAGGVDFGVIPREAMLMVGVQYYLLHHVSAASLLGYMASLECFPSSMEQIAALELEHGPAVMRTARRHAEEDIAHGRKILAFIDTRPVQEHAAIHEAAMQSCHFLTTAVTSMEAVNG